MTTTYVVDQIDGPGRGVVHLRSGPVGPAGPAALIPIAGLSCWFAAGEPGPPTDLWINLEELDPDLLGQIVGPEGPSLASTKAVERLTFESSTLPWIEPASRLAALELARQAPTAGPQPELWALEASLLRSVLADLGFDRPDKLDEEIETMLPALDAGLLGEPIDPIFVLALALAHEAANPLGDAYQRLPADDGMLMGGWSEVAAALDGLRPDRPASELVTMSAGDDWSLHDLLWMWLPDSFFPDGEFAARATMLQERQGLKKVLHITAERPPSDDVPLFVRLLTNTATDPTVIAADATLLEGNQYKSHMNHPRGIVDGQLRVEILADLGTKILDDREFARECGEQSARLALRAERTLDRDEARRRWFLSESHHRSSGNDEAADQARKAATAGEGTRTNHRLFVAESNLAARRDPDG